MLANTLFGIPLPSFPGSRCRTCAGWVDDGGMEPSASNNWTDDGLIPYRSGMRECSHCFVLVKKMKGKGMTLGRYAPSKGKALVAWRGGATLDVLEFRNPKKERKVFWDGALSVQGALELLVERKVPSPFGLVLALKMNQENLQKHYLRNVPVNYSMGAYVQALLFTPKMRVVRIRPGIVLDVAGVAAEQYRNAPPSLPKGGAKKEREREEWKAKKIAIDAESAKQGLSVPEKAVADCIFFRRLVKQ